MFTDRYKLREGNFSVPLPSVMFMLCCPGVMQEDGKADCVTIYAQCAGLTNACRAVCGKEIQICRLESGHSKKVSGEPAICACGASSEGEHKNFCPCNEKAPQPDSHFRCSFKLRIKLTGSDFVLAEISHAASNNTAHVLPDKQPVQQRKRKLSETAKQDFDSAHLRDKVTAARWKACKRSAAL
jgi:hypothetical protein